MAPRLPLEVIEHIIDDVARNDDHVVDNNFSSIKACALVCSSFLHLCRKYIFGYVSLNDPVVWRFASSPTSDDLNRLLSNSPHLAVYIRTLYYHVNKKEFVTKRFSWLLPMFKKLVRLQKLTIIHKRSVQLDWMQSSERKVLLPLLQLPTLTSISLVRIRNFPLADLAGCVNLKDLRIRSLGYSNDVGNFLEALPTTPMMLERLVINGGHAGPLQRLCDARRPDGKPIIDFSSLKELEIDAEAARLDSMKGFVEICKNLHKIKLSIGHNRDVLMTYPPDTDFESISSVKGLFAMIKPSLPTLVDIDIEYIIEEEANNDPLAGLCHELEKMIGQNVVETIKVVMWVFPGYDCTRWGELDGVLMGSPDGWPALRKVSLIFNLIENDTDKALRELSMTKLVESKRVQFDLAIRYPLSD